MQEVLLFYILLFVFLARWFINWTLLNTDNETSFSMFTTNLPPSSFLKLLKHIVVSEWKFWWFNLEEQKSAKIMSNTLSAIIYSLSLLLIISLIFKYKV